MKLLVHTPDNGDYMFELDAVQIVQSSKTEYALKCHRNFGYSFIITTSLEDVTNAFVTLYNYDRAEINGKLLNPR